MESLNATSLRRKPGQMGHPTFVTGAGAGSLRSQLAPAVTFDVEAIIRMFLPPFGILIQGIRVQRRSQC
jgi:hypothetical protein